MHCSIVTTSESPFNKLKFVVAKDLSNLDISMEETYSVITVNAKTKTQHKRKTPKNSQMGISPPPI